MDRFSSGGTLFIPFFGTLLHSRRHMGLFSTNGLKTGLSMMHLWTQFFVFTVSVRGGDVQTFLK
jgi:hypothetical protein